MLTLSWMGLFMVANDAKSDSKFLDPRVDKNLCPSLRCNWIIQCVCLRLCFSRNTPSYQPILKSLSGVNFKIYVWHFVTSMAVFRWHTSCRHPGQLRASNLTAWLVSPNSNVSQYKYPISSELISNMSRVGRKNVPSNDSCYFCHSFRCHILVTRLWCCTWNAFLLQLGCIFTALEMHFRCSSGRFYDEESCKGCFNECPLSQ